ncbi:hypothetical protein BC833DRAFT_596067 [Globomyces pollinis-pini]|nr:hypothetical protein BC833DRAFT_596067 [Globomyces pollinis-pini]
MGQQNSALVVPMASYCEQLAINSKRCMKKYDFDRELYRAHCTKEFQEYKDCKEQWVPFYIFIYH